MMGSSTARDSGAVALTAVLAVFGLALAIWFASLPSDALRSRLIVLQFWWLAAGFGLLAATSARELPALIRSIRFRRNQWLAAGAIALLAGLLASAVAPRTNRIYYDEHIYQGIGQNLTDLRRAQMCNAGIVEYRTLQCTSSEYNKQPYAYPFLLSIGYRLFGVSDQLAHVVNITALMAHVLTIVLLSALLTSSAGAAIAAAAVFATIPQQIQWSATAAAEPTAALACTAAVLSAAWFARSRRFGSLLWTVAVSAWAAQFRPESLLILPVVAIVIALQAPEELRRGRIVFALVLGYALLTVHAGHLMAVRNEAWGTTGDRLSGAFLLSNLSANGWFYLADWRFPAVYGVLALAGLILPGDRSPRVIFGVYFLALWGIFLAFYAGSYNYGADIRYSLMSYAPLALLAGRAVSIAADRFGGRRRTTPWIVAGFFAANLLLYLPQLRAVGEEAWAARADVRIAKQFASTLPQDSMILTHNPHMFHLWGRNASQVFLGASDPAFLSNLNERFGGGVYLHWGFWCNVDDMAQRALCAKVLAEHPGTMVFEQRERDYRYAFYRLDVTPAITFTPLPR